MKTGGVMKGARPLPWVDSRSVPIFVLNFLFPTVSGIPKSPHFYGIIVT